MAHKISEELKAVLKEAGATRFLHGPVVNIAIEMPAMSGGLRDAVDVEPFLIDDGELAFLLVEVSADGKYTHRPYIDKNAGEKKDERHGPPWTLVQTLKPGTVARIDEDLVVSAIDGMADRVRALRDDEAGTPQLPSISDPPTEDELAAAREAQDDSFDGGDEAEFLADAAATDEEETE